MKRLDQNDSKYFAGHIFLDKSFMRDVDKYVCLREEKIKGLIEENERLKKKITLFNLTQNK